VIIFPAPLYLRTLWRYTNAVIIIIIIILIAGVSGRLGPGRPAIDSKPPPHQQVRPTASLPRLKPDLAGIICRRQWRRQLWGTGARAPSTSNNFIFSSLWSKSESQLSNYCVICEISWCRCQQLTALSISTASVTKLLVIDQLLHPALKPADGCPVT